MYLSVFMLSNTVSSVYAVCGALFVYTVYSVCRQSIDSNVSMLSIVSIGCL